MELVRSEQKLRLFGLIALAVGLVLSGLGIAVWVSLMPPGILVALLGVVLLIIDAAGDALS